MAQTVKLSSRYFSVCRALRDSLSEPLQQTSAPAHEGGFKIWKNIFLFVCIPTMGLSYLNVQMLEKEERPEFKKYSYMRIRNKKYPWRDGTQTLFHNPHVNALPDGYESTH